MSSSSLLDALLSPPGTVRCHQCMRAIPYDHAAQCSSCGDYFCGEPGSRCDRCSCDDERDYYAKNLLWTSATWGGRA
jgi:hypothetical protein